MHDTEALSALEQVEQAAGSLWTRIDESSAVFAEYENAHDDVVSHLKAMRRSYASSLRLLRMLQEFQRTVRDGVQQFAQKIGKFENHISRTALNYGLNLLPDDVLSEIFVLAGAEITLNEKAALSLVCKRFRRVMMSMQRMWDGYWIKSNHTPEQIISVAEGNGFVSLKASIGPPIYVPDSVKAWISDRELDRKEYKMRYHKFAVGLILSFELEELEIHDLKKTVWKEIEPILAGGNMQNLRSLVMPGVVQNSVGACLLTKWHMPLLRNLEVDFVPGAALGRTLVQCSLGSSCWQRVIGEDEIDSLREFLATARSLQDLRLFLRPAARFYEVCDLPSLRSLEVNFQPHPSLVTHLVRCGLHRIREDEIDSLREFLATARSLQHLRLFLYISVEFYEVCDLPSLRSLEVNFEPHPSLARHLVRFQLFLPTDRTVSLSRMLDFLSSSEALQELSTEEWGRGFSDDPGATERSVVTMPNVVTCELLDYETSPTLVAKLHMPMLRTLILRLSRLRDLSMMTRNEFRTSLQSLSSLEDLELCGLGGIDYLDEIVRYAPPHLESFSLVRRDFRFRISGGWGASPVPRRKLIRFVYCDGFFPFLPDFVDYLRAVDLGGIKLLFYGCKECRDGTFGLEDVMSARIDT